MLRPLPLSALAAASLILFAPRPAVAAADPVLVMIPRVFDRAATQCELLIEAAGDSGRFPRTVDKDGKVRLVQAEDWTSGFFPGTLWLIHEYTGSDVWKQRAVASTRGVERIRHFKGHHDVGFMLGCSYGQQMRLAPDAAAKAVLLDGAKSLATRYREKPGLIRSWDFGNYSYPVIIDNMMNLELLLWAARNDGGDELREIAVAHADKTLANHFRADGSAYHVLDYSPETGAVRSIHARQGYDVLTAWARGQSWAAYGFSMAYRITGDSKYLVRARDVADFYRNHPDLPADKVPYWDFGVAPGDDVPRDASSAAIMASAMVEISRHLGTREGAPYLEFARDQLLALGSPAYLSESGANGGFLLARSTGSAPENSEVDVPLNYADYYFLEALLRYRAAVGGTEREEFGDLR